MDKPTKPIDDGLLRQQLSIAIAGNYPGTTASSSFLDDCMMFINADRKQLLDRVEKIIGEDDTSDTMMNVQRNGANDLRSVQRTSLAKLRKELGV